MAVAVKTEPTVGTSMPSLGLAGASLAGALYVSAGVIGLYNILPWIWGMYVGDGFYPRALLVLLMMAGAAAMIYVWPRVSRPQPGLRMGIAFGVVFLFVGAFVTYVIGVIVDWLGIIPKLAATRDAQAVAGMVLTALIGCLWVWWLARLLRKERWQERLVQWEEQGWFVVKSYKKGQGLRARRATMLGIMGLVGCGLWVHLQSTNVFAAEPWKVNIPYSIGGWYEVSEGSIAALRAEHVPEPVLSKIAALQGPEFRHDDLRRAITTIVDKESADRYSTLILSHAYIGPRLILLWLPSLSLIVLIGGATIWFSYRLVNFPKFADFLIATEAEMSKITWSSRRRLIQDTIVVLVTVIFMTVFLYMMDITWSFLLTWLGVLHTQ